MERLYAFASGAGLLGLVAALVSGNLPGAHVPFFLMLIMVWSLVNMAAFAAMMMIYHQALGLVGGFLGFISVYSLIFFLPRSGMEDDLRIQAALMITGIMTTGPSLGLMFLAFAKQKPEGQQAA